MTQPPTGLVQFIVGYQKNPSEWVFAGVYEVEPPAAPAGATPEQLAAMETGMAEEAVRMAALDHEESDLFSVIPMAKIKQVRIAYRRRIVGIAHDNPPPA